MDAQIVGERIAKLRKSHNMTQKQLADELSVTYKAVSKWETGAGLPDIAILPTLASALNVSVDEIVSGSSNDDHKKDNDNNLDSQNMTEKRFFKKPAMIIMTSFIIAIFAFAIIFINLKPNREAGYDDGISVRLETSSGFGVTSDHAKEIYDKQTAENIRTHLLQFDQIDDAAVSVDTAEISPFRIQDNENGSKVFVILTIADSYTFSDIDIQAIENLIRSSVPDIKDENINIS